MRHQKVVESGKIPELVSKTRFESIVNAYCACFSGRVVELPWGYSLQVDKHVS
jgi:hypothetical protein